MKILLTVDGSPYTRKMLDYVCANRTLFDDSHSYTLFHAQTPLPPHARNALGATVVKDYHADEAAKVLEPALATLTSHGLKADSQWKVGSAGDTIAAFADEGKYELLLMGSQGHGSLARLVMGSVTTQVLAQCGVPVLLIR
ncbi:universal stress protein [Caenimonas sedimenti]|uniref:Universal stress protein n=1 Tax=Caenimonas sedimenti TaxID=2596921 RepID=A0A562ZSA8_9BURK|nr:universal stress protein [Caenimonas sedimenti]TWO71034.1 universal stress protein [Caenimonas sedimenti]